MKCTFTFTIVGLALLMGAGVAVAQPSQDAVAGFDSYVAGVERRLALQHRSATGFQAPEPEGRLRGGELVVERLTPEVDSVPGALLHHWRASAFVPGATSASLEEVLRDFGGYAAVFAPQVLEARVLGGSGDRVQVFLRVRQRHVLTVVLDTIYDVGFGRLDALHSFSVSRSSRISEIEAAGTRAERPLSAGEDHGFLWRTVTFWSWVQRDGGLFVQIESVSLSRAIPVGVGWAVRPFVESVPRESLAFTLGSVRRKLEERRTGAP